MRIAMVSEHASPLAHLGGADAGGQNVHVDALARQLAKASGAEVVVYTRRDDARLPRRVPLCPGVVVEHVDAGPPVVLPKDELLPLMDEFADDLERSWTLERPDVVHAHFWMSGLASLRAARSLDIPLAVTFHALGSEKRRHQGARDTSPDERVAIESAIAAAADLVISTSAAECGELDAMGVVRCNSVVVPCGVDTSLFRPRARGGRATKRILSVGRFVDRKGVDDVIAALAYLPGVELSIAGGSDRSLLEEDEDVQRLRRRARAAGVEDRVEFLGQVRHDEMPELMSSADVVACTPWYEPFGLVAIEAMACGIPVIASKVGGLAHTVVDGVTGIHVPPRDPRAIADAARRISDRDLGRRLGAAGRRRAESLFSWEQVGRATLDAYETVLLQRRSYGALR